MALLNVRRLVATLGVAAFALNLLPLIALPTGASATGVDYQLTVTESAPSMTYGDLTPSFVAHLTVPSDDPPLAFNTPFYVAIDSQNYSGSVSGTFPTYTLSVSPQPPPSPSAGQHAVVAKYLSPKHGWLTSAPLVLTVLKKMAVLSCYTSNVTNTYAPNTPLTIRVEFSNTNAPVDIQNGTFSVTFTGPRTFTSANLSANGAGQIFVAAPPAAGVYRVRCAFSGTSSFSPVDGYMGVPTIIVSANHPVGRISLYTNPTPVSQGVFTSWLVVISARSGLPVPTGDISIRIGTAYTKIIALEAGGRVTFQAVAPTLGPSSVITVWYHGDPVYAASSANFPLATPPISSYAAPGAGSAVSNAASATASPTPAPTPTPAATESPTAAAQAIALPSASHRFDAALASSAGQRGGVVSYVLGALAGVTLLAVGAGLAWRLRRRS